MKEPHIEGVANHDDPESCAGAREDAGEALTGARTGRALSREISDFGAPTLSRHAEGITTGTALARDRSALRGQRPLARAESLCAGAGRSLALSPLMERRDASERPMAPSR